VFPPKRFRRYCRSFVLENEIFGQNLLYATEAEKVRTFDLDAECSIRIGRVGEELIPTAEQFDEIWNLHPLEHSELFIHGKQVKMPRWDQAYERDYPFAKQVAVAEPAPLRMRRYLDWCQREIDKRTNGLFVNWHDGAQSHYHGKHRDSVSGLVEGSSIVTVSLGEERVFRLRAYPDGKPKFDFVLQSGDFIVIPWKTNQRWTHEVPKFVRYRGRRVSVTLRAFA